MTNRLIDHRQAWKKKKILQAAYLEWYNDIVRDCSRAEGATVELGGGGGNFKEFHSDAVTTDITFSPWLDVCCDAQALPFRSSSVSNFIMVDVLHHLSDPINFLHEAWSRLAPGGRILMVEPYPSPFSRIIYRLVHPEPFIYDENYFAGRLVRRKDPWDSNQAIPYLLFFRGLRTFQSEFVTMYRLLRRKRMSMILYPASGGFEHRALLPDFLIPFLKFSERLLTPLSRLLSFRCYIVLEKIPDLDSSISV